MHIIIVYSFTISVNSTKHIHSYNKGTTRFFSKLKRVSNELKSNTIYQVKNPSDNRVKN